MSSFSANILQSKDYLCYFPIALVNIDMREKNIHPSQMRWNVHMEDILRIGWDST